MATHLKDVCRPTAALTLKRRAQRTTAMRAWHTKYVDTLGMLLSVAASMTDCVHAVDKHALVALGEFDTCRPVRSLAVLSLRCCTVCREARKVSRADETRLAALRDSNYEEYVRLAQQAKDGRLHELLDKTDAIIAELGAKVFHGCDLSQRRLVDKFRVHT